MSLLCTVLYVVFVNLSTQEKIMCLRDLIQLFVLPSCLYWEEATGDIKINLKKIRNGQYGL